MPNRIHLISKVFTTMLPLESLTISSENDTVELNTGENFRSPRD